MATVTHEETRWVRIVYDDETVVETEMTPAMARAIRRMEWADDQRERRHRAREQTFTDAGVSPAKAADGARRRHPNAKGEPSPWEGPRYEFTLLLGLQPIWSGPESLWVTADGGKTWRCRFCSHLARMPAIACCLNPDCNRTGRD